MKRVTTAAAAARSDIYFYYCTPKNKTVSVSTQTFIKLGTFFDSQTDFN